MFLRVPEMMQGEMRLKGCDGLCCVNDRLHSPKTTSEKDPEKDRLSAGIDVAIDSLGAALRRGDVYAFSRFSFTHLSRKRRHATTKPRITNVAISLQHKLSIQGNLVLIQLR